MVADKPLISCSPNAEILILHVVSSLAGASTVNTIVKITRHSTMIEILQVKYLNTAF